MPLLAPQRTSMRPASAQRRRPGPHRAHRPGRHAHARSRPCDRLRVRVRVSHGLSRAPVNSTSASHPPSESTFGDLTAKSLFGWTDRVRAGDVGSLEIASYTLPSGAARHLRAARSPRSVTNTARVRERCEGGGRGNATKPRPREAPYTPQPPLARMAEQREGADGTKGAAA